jgi:uncharacterized delta-60 repeat protein
MSTGMLDPKFGTGGIVPVGFTSFDIAVDSAGRTVVAGDMRGDFAVLRLNPNGTPDGTFGSTGLVTTDFGGKRFDRAQRVAIQSDGKIVVAGMAVNSGGVGNPANGRFALVRYNPNGSLDTSFGDGGKETVLGNLTSHGVGAIGIQGDDKIVFAGDRQHDDDFDFITFRLQSNGLLDGTFGDARGSGSAGYVYTGMGDHDMPSALVIQPDGRIVVGGTKDVLSDELNRDEFAIARYTAAGKLDRSFDGDGKLLSRFIGDATLFAMTAQPDGKILAAGSMRGRDGHSHMLLTRFLADGSVDNTLGTGTIVADATPNISSTIATNIFVRAGKIVIVGVEQAAGQVANTFATQYLLNGSLDTSFGSDGVAHMNIAGGAGWARAALAPDGKVVFAYQGGTTFGGVARFVQVIPKAYVVANGFITTEGKDTGSFRVGRDAQYDFPTRVYINLRGTAIYGKDYTADMTIPAVPVDTQGNPIDLHGIVLDSPVQGYVDIPAGRSEITVSVNPINDNQIEPTKQATFILFDNPNYARNQLLQDTFVRIFDDDDARIDFAAKGGTTKAGDRADTGAKFGDRGNGLQYGWDVDNSANARNRGNKRSPDPRFDTFNHMQRAGANRKWEIAVPNGLYQVTIVAGDPNATDSVYRINLEGQLALSGIPGGDVHWFSRTTDVMVTDGRLTVSNGVGAVNNKIAYIEIKNPTYDAQPGIVTPDTPIRLKPASAKTPMKKSLDGSRRPLFSQLEMGLVVS